MKATLEFELPEETSQLEIAINASEYRGLIMEMDQWLRGIIKYSGDGISETELTIYSQVREKLFELIKDRDLQAHF
jgi:hypothetical protein